MIVAELEVFHSRPIVPTRRVALGHYDLPTGPQPALGGVLLGGIAARFGGGLDAELFAELLVLIDQVEAGERIPQPRLRHRFQQDRIGLIGSRHRLLRDGDGMRFRLDDANAAPAQHVLAAVYAAGELERSGRLVLLTAIRRGLRWTGEVGPSLIEHLVGRADSTDWSITGTADQVVWALGVLGLPGDANGHRPPRAMIQRQFRAALREAHPDHGGETVAAAERIRDLTEARRILLP